MEILWLGHSCFRVRGKEAVVITDPYGPECGYHLVRPSAQVVTVSHSHPNHDNWKAIGGEPKLVDGPGEYEFCPGGELGVGVFITGITTYQDTEQGRQFGKNTVYLIEMEELTLCHLGDLGHVPTPEQVEAMSPVDILLVPVGGVCTIAAAAAAETVGLLEPKLVVPMHYKTEALTFELEPLGRFLREMGLKEAPPLPRLTVSKSTLPETTQVVVLDYRR